MSTDVQPPADADEGMNVAVGAEGNQQDVHGRRVIAMGSQAATARLPEKGIDAGRYVSM